MFKSKSTTVATDNINDKVQLSKDNVKLISKLPETN